MCKRHNGHWLYKWSSLPSLCIKYQTLFVAGKDGRCKIERKTEKQGKGKEIQTKASGIIIILYNAFHIPKVFRDLFPTINGHHWYFLPRQNVNYSMFGNVAISSHNVKKLRSYLYINLGISKSQFMAGDACAHIIAK